MAVIAPFLTKLQASGELSDDDRAALSQVMGDIRPFPMRRDIIREGERPDFVHLIVSGWACRYQIVKDGSRQITAFMLPGDFCDTHIALFGAMDHSIGALTDARIAMIPHARMRELVQRPAIVRAFWWASLVDEAVLRAWIVNLGRRNAFDRVAHLICELHARLSHVGLVTGGAFLLPLTQEELSDALGLTGVHINRTFAKLRDAGLMTFRRGEIVITDIGALRQQAGFDTSYLHQTRMLSPAWPI